MGGWGKKVLYSPTEKQSPPLEFDLCFLIFLFVQLYKISIIDVTYSINKIMYGGEDLVYTVFNASFIM